jgi:hypothetical protein
MPITTRALRNGALEARNNLLLLFLLLCAFYLASRVLAFEVLAGESTMASSARRTAVSDSFPSFLSFTVVVMLCFETERGGASHSLHEVLVVSSSSFLRRSLSGWRAGRATLTSFCLLHRPDISSFYFSSRRHTGRLKPCLHLFASAVCNIQRYPSSASLHTCSEQYSGPQFLCVASH